MTNIEQITKLRKTVERVRTTIAGLANAGYEANIDPLQLLRLREAQRALNLAISLLNQIA